MQIDYIIRNLTKPQRWFMKYGTYRNYEGSYQLNRCLIDKGLRNPDAIGGPTKLGEEDRAKLQEKEND